MGAVSERFLQIQITERGGMLSRTMAQRIEHRKLAELTPYPRNPRRHSDAPIAQIAGSIAQFGFNSPILIDSKGNIIAGHGRWEPLFHFSAPEARIKFRPTAVGHLSEDCFEYSPNNPKSTSGSGLLGTGGRGSAAGRLGADDGDGRFAGIARPSNVIEVKSESSQGSHSAPFPRALVEFFVKAFSDEELHEGARERRPRGVLR